jgi:hypothetical protein
MFYAESQKRVISMNLTGKNLYIALALISALFFLFILWKIPQWQSDAFRAQLPPGTIHDLKPPERVQLERNAADIENSTRLTLAQIIGGLALLSGLYFTYLNVKTAQANLRITEEGKLTDRFSKAVELLGSENLDVRLGGIYALERIARDSQKDHWTVMEVLTAFVRENSREKPEDTEETGEKETAPKRKETKPREDIQATMTVIGRRKWIETETQRLNLQRVNLAVYVLEGVNLSRADLSGADLSGADLSGADLSGAFLTGANLSETFLIGADLSGAYLSEANLSRAFLTGAKLSEAKLSEANLSGAFMTGANFEDTKLITFKQILQAKNPERAILPPELKMELEEWQAKRARERQSAGEGSSGDEG